MSGSDCHALEKLWERTNIDCAAKVKTCQELLLCNLVHKIVSFDHQPKYIERPLVCSKRYWQICHCHSVLVGDDSGEREPMFQGKLEFFFGWCVCLHRTKCYVDWLYNSLGIYWLYNSLGISCLWMPPAGCVATCIFLNISRQHFYPRESQCNPYWMGVSYDVYHHAAAWYDVKFVHVVHQ